MDLIKQKNSNDPEITVEAESVGYNFEHKMKLKDVASSTPFGIKEIRFLSDEMIKNSAEDADVLEVEDLHNEKEKLIKEKHERKRKKELFFRILYGGRSNGKSYLMTHMFRAHIDGFDIMEISVETNSVKFTKSYKSNYEPYTFNYGTSDIRTLAELGNYFGMSVINSMQKKIEEFGLIENKITNKETT